MGLIPQEYNKGHGADQRSTTKCLGLISGVQQNARGWFQEYKKVPETDPNAGVQQSARGWSQKYIKVPEADPNRQVETPGILLYFWDQGVVTNCPILVGKGQPNNYNNCTINYL